MTQKGHRSTSVARLAACLHCMVTPSPPPHPFQAIQLVPGAHMDLSFGPILHAFPGAHAHPSALVGGMRGPLCTPGTGALDPTGANTADGVGCAFK